MDMGWGVLFRYFNFIEKEESVYGAFGARQEHHGTLFPMMRAV
jgi:hypothetical protein